MGRKERFDIIELRFAIAALKCTGAGVDQQGHNVLIARSTGRARCVWGSECFIGIMLRGSASAASDVSDSGGSGSSSGSSKSIGHTKRTHGILGIIGWSLFLPYGAIAARYFKHHDPLWFYLHVGIQFVGFLLGLAGVLVGVSLYITQYMPIFPHTKALESSFLCSVFFRFCP
ncbi:cytochrome b561/ferric reductase transmembrane with DOMON related domain-containing protein [Actinidia rufa]|uniref:Cytochrome b561/ferric reductase transmembrane with DOMON related domain-containing protein n=1 Tax=Actinidia rufa TaxID=165716 RepID=A0A7J0EW80_9ERIC|nr:cytochrome b561/ferric reductase transmembrane with DOMON related domain-containing protein [Actinidia rufa]